MYKNPEFQFASRRSPVISRRGMVAASQPLAAAAGIESLAQGGSAADAAVATAAALNVTEPGSTGLGGDCFALYYQAETRQVYALNGSGRAPASLTLERLAEAGFTGELPQFHPYTITVPGACAGWCDLVERFGRLPLSRTLAPAIRLAEGGFPVAPITAHFWQRGVERQLSKALNGSELTIDGRAPHPGEIFRNLGLVRTLKAIAAGGKQAYYQGAIAEAIAATVQAAGGCLHLEDLAAHCSTWDQPISTMYRGLRIWECPPNGQGLAALIALNILEGFDLSRYAGLSSSRLHLEIEALRLAFADTAWYVADPEFNPPPLERLLSGEYAAERRSRLNPVKATLDQRRGTPAVGSDTVYLSVVDGEGNACSFINSNYFGFGTGIVPSGWGFSLQNRGHNFSLDPNHPNALAPGKRPYHTIIPALATHPDGKLYACFGVMGGFMQPQGHVQVIVGLVDDGLDPQAALDRPRFCIEDGRAGGRVALEEGIPTQTYTELAEMGHPVYDVTGFSRAIFGRGQVIVREKDSGVLWGGSDPRADGSAMCL
jgi:gamma-glutamyltranspeptidase/glutathione hydrolase